MLRLAAGHALSDTTCCEKQRRPRPRASDPICFKERRLRPLASDHMCYNEGYGRAIRALMLQAKRKSNSAQEATEQARGPSTEGNRAQKATQQARLEGTQGNTASKWDPEQKATKHKRQHGKQGGPTQKATKRKSNSAQKATEQARGPSLEGNKAQKATRQAMLVGTKGHKHLILRLEILDLQEAWPHSRRGWAGPGRREAELSTATAVCDSTAPASAARSRAQA